MRVFLSYSLSTARAFEQHLHAFAFRKQEPGCLQVAKAVLSPHSDPADLSKPVEFNGDLKHEELHSSRTEIVCQGIAA